MADELAFREFASLLHKITYDDGDRATALDILCVQLHLQPNPATGHEHHPVVPKREDVDEAVCEQYLSAILAAHERLQQADVRSAERHLCGDPARRPRGNDIAAAFDDYEDLQLGNARRELNVVLRTMSSEHQDRFLKLLRKLKNGMHGYQVRGEDRNVVWTEAGTDPDSALERYCAQLLWAEGGGH